MLVIGFLFFSFGDLRAQGADTPAARPATLPPVKLKRPAVPKIKPLTTEFSGGLKLNTDGWSVFAERGTIRSEETKYRDLFHNVRVYTLELAEHRHPKEIRIGRAGDPGQTRPFYYGKVANFFTAKAGYGVRHMIAGKPEPGTVSIHWVYSGGLALGLEKPYYIETYASSFGTAVGPAVRYSDTTAGIFLSEGQVSGAANFSKGLSEIKVVPGVHARTGLHFDFARQRKTKLAVEVGAAAELYTRPVLIMANQKASPFFGSLYAAVQIGKRW